MAVEIQIDDRQLRELQAALKALPDEAQAAYNRALQRTTASVRRDVAKRLASRVGVRQASVRRRVKGYKRGSGRRIFIGLNSLPASAFVSRSQARRQRQRSLGPGARSRSGGGVTVGGVTYPRSFWFDRGGRNPFAFQRTGRGRYPIEPLEIPIAEEAEPIVRDQHSGLADRFHDEYEKALRGLVRSRGGA